MSTPKLKLEWVTNVPERNLRDGRTEFKNGIEGEPQASELYSVEELKSMGFVGIYKREGDEDFRLIKSPHPKLKV